MHRRNVQRENDTRVLAGMLMSKELQAEEWGCTSNEEGEQESNAFFFVVVFVSFVLVVADMAVVSDEDFFLEVFDFFAIVFFFLLLVASRVVDSVSDRSKLSLVVTNMI